MPLNVVEREDRAPSVLLPDAEAVDCAMFSRAVVSNVSSKLFPETLAKAEGKDRNPSLLMEILLVLESNS